MFHPEHSDGDSMQCFNFLITTSVKRGRAEVREFTLVLRPQLQLLLSISNTCPKARPKKGGKAPQCEVSEPKQDGENGQTRDDSVEVFDSSRVMWGSVWGGWGEDSACIGKDGVPARDSSAYGQSPSRVRKSPHEGQPVWDFELQVD